MRLDGALALRPQATPSAPPAGTLVYTKTGGGVYYRDAGGAEIQLGGAGAAPGNMLTTDTAQRVTGTKTFEIGDLLVEHPVTGTVHEPYSDANPPQSFEMTQAAAAPTPPAGEGVLWTLDGKSLFMKAPDGVVTQIHPHVAPGVLANATVATTETVIASFDVAANYLTAGSVLRLAHAGQVSSTATLIYRVRMGTTGTATDAQLIQMTTSAAGVANQHTSLDLLVAMLTATTATASGDGRLASGRFGPATAAFAAATVNLTVANKITLTVVQSVAQTLTSRIGVLNRIT